MWSEKIEDLINNHLGENMETENGLVSEKSKVLDVVGIHKYFDKNGEEQKSFVKCGVAFERKNNEGYVLRLNAHCLTGEYLLSKSLPAKEATTF